jgi:hypothetical protein
MRISTKAASLAAAALFIVPSSASAFGTIESEKYERGANWRISGNAGYDPTLPSLTGDVFILRGAPLEGEVWYFGHGPCGDRMNGIYNHDYDPSKRRGCRTQR